ncbi:hypothetical protein AGMMS49938_04370 [Fibrobacterales bacterium]|nr:hypothetical protein AGMMS49938_04370 [Fibrobacterales bacterium]
MLLGWINLWFVLGMAFCFFGMVKATVPWKVVALLGLFLPVSAILAYSGFITTGLRPLLTLWGVAFSVFLFLKCSKENWFPQNTVKWLAKWTMPIFLLHTICAAPFRALLLKQGIYSVELHWIVGIAASLVLPIAIGWVAERSVYLNFFFAPLSTVRMVREVKA